MKKTLFAMMITVSLLCIGLSQVANVQSAQVMKIGITVQSWNLGQFDAQTIASHFDMSISSYVGPPPNSMDYTAKMNQVRSLNPDFKFLMYRNCIETQDLTAAELNNAIALGWILKDSSGNLVATIDSDGYLVDFGNPAYQQWYASAKVKTCLDQYPAFDGIFADNSMKRQAIELEWEYRAKPINPRTGTYWTDAETVTASQGMLNAIANAIAPKIFCSNGVWNGPTFWGSNNYRQIISGVPGLNAIFSEGTWAFNYGSGSSFWYSEADWRQSVDFLTWVQTNLLSGHPERISGTTCRVDATAANLPPSTTRDQIMMFGFCSELLGAGSVGHNTIFFGDVSGYPNLMALAQTLRTTDMGDPLAAYYKVAGTSVYARDFVNGKVMVNPTSTPYTVTLPTAFRTLDGQLINSVNIQQHTGVVLFSTTPSTPPPTPGAAIMADGFESGNFNAWQYAPNARIVTSPVHSGSYATQFVTVPSTYSCFVGSRQMPASYSHLFLRAYWRFENLPTDPAIAILSSMSGDFADFAMFRNTNTGKYYFGLYNNSGTWSYILSADQTINVGVWYCFEYEVMPGTNGVLNLWMDGRNIIHASGNIGLHGPTSVNSFTVGVPWSWATTPITAEIDDVVLSTVYVGPITPTQGVLFQDGYETNDFSKWTDVFSTSATGSIQIAIAHSGTYGLRVVTAGASSNEVYSCHKSIDITNPDTYVRLYFKVNSRTAGGGNLYFAYLWGANGYQAFQAYMGIERTWNGYDRYFILLGGPTSASGTFTRTAYITTDSNWHCMEMHWKRDTTNGFAELWVDGQKVLETEHRQTDMFGDVRNVYAGLALSTYSSTTHVVADVSIDDVVVSNSYIGAS